MPDDDFSDLVWSRGGSFADDADASDWTRNNSAVLHVLGFRAKNAGASSELFKTAPCPSLEDADVTFALGLFGRCTTTGQSVSVIVKNVQPWVRLEVDDGVRVRDLVEKLAKYCKWPTLREHVGLERKHRFFGYEADPTDPFKRRLRRFLKIECPSMRLYRMIERAAKDLSGVSLVDQKILPLQKLLLDAGISYNEVFNVNLEHATINEDPDVRWSHCDTELTVNRIDCLKGTNEGPKTAVPWVICSIDIEVNPVSHGFPTPFDGGSHTFCVSASFWRFGTTENHSVLLYLGEDASKVAKPESSTSTSIVEVYPTVHRLFEALRHLIVVRADADIITGYNIFGFDLPFLWSEYILHGVSGSLRSSTTLKSARLSDDAIEAKFGCRAGLWARGSRPIPNVLAQFLGASMDDDSPPRVELEHEMPEAGLHWSRFRSHRCVMVEKLMQTAARGDNIYLTLGPMHGRTMVDMMQILKDDKKPPDNSLDYASRNFLRKERGSAEKIDLDKHEMFDMYRRGDPADQWIIGDYCIRDSLICLWLMEDCKYFGQWLEMSRASGTSIDDICNSGQQRKVFNSIMLMLWNRLPLSTVLSPSNANALELEDLPSAGFVLNEADSGWPTISTDDEDGRKAADYQGATVLEPVTGFHETPVGSLDFNSLYPSIIRDRNLCYSTIVIDEVERRSVRMNKVPHSEYAITHVNADGSTFEKTYMFVEHVGGVLPKVLAYQLQLRKQIKAAMKKETDLFRKWVLDGQQLAVKVLMNSLYGFTGVSSGMMGCKPIAAVVTLRGRAMIELAKSTAEEMVPGLVVLYGDTDSIMVKFPPIDDRPCTLKEAFEIGDRVAAAITNKFSMVVKIELEAVKWPFLLLGKKKYAAVQYESADGHGETILRGLEPVRRDFTGLVKETYKKCLKGVLNERSLDNARQALLDAVVSVLEDTRPISDYVITKGLGAEYKDPTSVPQYRAWQRMQERGDLNVPVIGMRMPYVVTAGTGPQFERTEHPDYVEKAKIPLDKQYYLESLQRPIYDLLSTTDIPVDTIVQRAIKLSETLKGIETHGSTWAKAGFVIGRSKSGLMEKFKDLAGKSRKRSADVVARTSEEPPKKTKTSSLFDFVKKSR